MRILWLKTELLHPVDKGGKIRTYNMLKNLKADHEITYLTLDAGDAAPDAHESATEYSDELIPVPIRLAKKAGASLVSSYSKSLMATTPYFLQRYRSPAMAERIAEQTSLGAHDLLVCDFLMPAVNIRPAVFTRIPTLLFQHNIEAVIWKRHFQVATNAVKKTLLWWEWKKAVRSESELSARFHRVVAVSEADAELMRSQYSLPHVAAVPTGVDIEYFGATEIATRPRRENHLIFTGSMDWLPNEDAALYFVREVLPLISARIPNVSISFVGRNPTAAVRGLAQLANVDVTGRVPDIRPYLKEAAVFVVPLRVGGGTRLKIYEAMAAGLPIVSTSVGAEGLDVQPEEHLLLADSASDFADRVVDLLDHPDSARERAHRARDYVEGSKSWRTVSRLFTRECEETVKQFELAGRRA